MTRDIAISFSKSDTMDPRFQAHFDTRYGPFENVKNFILDKVWSPIVFNNGYRSKKNFISSSLVVFDFDSGEWTIADAIKYVDFYDLRSLIATTKSHQKEKKSASGKVEQACDRFRLVIEAELCSSLDDFEYTMKSFMEDIPCDESCKDGARFYYPSKELIYERLNGNTIKWNKCPIDETDEMRFIRQQAYAESINKQIYNLPTYIMHPLRYGVATGERHKTTYKIACFMTIAGWSEQEILSWFHKLKSPLIAGIGADDVERCIGNAAARVREPKRPTTTTTTTGQKEERA